MYVQGKQAWQICANSTHSQTWARQVQAGARHARTKGTCRWWHGARKHGKDMRTQRALSTLVFGDVNLCCGLCLWNMTNAQSRGIVCGSPGVLLSSTGLQPKSKACGHRAGAGVPGHAPRWTSPHPPLANNSRGHARVLAAGLRQDYFCIF